MLREGTRVFIQGYQDYDNYCKKNGKVQALKVIVDEDGMMLQ
jgi:single-stranded DNA-binding protein